MIEMLGVLAIVGVLSVGRIAGYSKSMEMYKLNKQASAFNQLFYDFYNTVSKIREEQDGMTNIVKLIYDTGLVPDYFVLREYSSDILKDETGGSLFLYSNGSGKGTRIKNVSEI